MPGLDEIHRALGRLEGRVDGMLEDLDTISTDVKKMSKQMSEAKGGWKVLMAVGGASGAVGALIVKALPFLGAIR